MVVLAVLSCPFPFRAKAAFARRRSRTGGVGLLSTQEVTDEAGYDAEYKNAA